MTSIPEPEYTITLPITESDIATLSKLLVQTGSDEGWTKDDVRKPGTLETALLAEVIMNTLEDHVGAYDQDVQNAYDQSPQSLLASLRRLEAEVTDIKGLVGLLVEKQNISPSITFPGNVPPDVVDNLLNIGE